MADPIAQRAYSIIVFIYMHQHGSDLFCVFDGDRHSDKFMGGFAGGSAEQQGFGSLGDLLGCTRVDIGAVCRGGCRH